MQLNPTHLKKTITTKINSDESHYYELSLAANIFLQIDVEQQGIDLTLTLYNSDIGTNLIEINGLAFNFLTKTLYWITKENVHLVLKVKPREKHAAPGFYQLTLSQLKDKTKDDENYLLVQNLFSQAMSLYGQNVSESKHQALEKLTTLLEKNRHLNLEEKRFEILILLSNVCDFLGLPQKALIYTTEALNLAKDNPHKKSLCLNNLGNIYLILDPEKALSYLREALEIRNKVEDFDGEAITLGNLGVYYYQREETKKALSYYKEAYFLAEQAGNIFTQINLANNIGLVCQSLAQEELALKYYEKAVLLQSEHELILSQANTLRNIATIYANSQDFDLALVYCNQSLEISDRFGELAEKARTINLLGLICEKKEQQEALEYYKEALALATQINDISLQIAILNNIGLYYKDSSELSKSLDSLSEALFLANETGDLVNQQIVTRNLGIAYRKLQDYQTALIYHRKSLELAIKLKNKEEEEKLLKEIQSFDSNKSHSPSP